MDADMEGPELCDASVVEMADEIRREHHPDIAGASIAYVFVPKCGAKNGKVSLGKAKHMAAVDSLLTGADFVIRLNYERWEKLTDIQRHALLDHELCHCTERGDKWAIRAHDVEEFGEIIERHGLWAPALERLATVMVQGNLFSEAKQ